MKIVTVRAMKRRWLLRLPADGDDDHVVSIEVPASGRGTAYAYVGGLRFVLSPADISRLRRVWADVQATALADQGGGSWPG